MNCKKCGVALRDCAKYCHMCGVSQVVSSPPRITGNEWFSFVRTGKYTLKYKFSSDLEITCNKRVVGLLSHYSDEENDNHFYDLVMNENDENPVIRFVRDDDKLSCVDPDSGHVFFAWQRLSSTLGEIAAGSKWQCGPLSLAQSGARSLAQWLPGGDLVASKYSVVDKDREIGIVSGSSTSFSNSKTVDVKDPVHAWALLAVAIILSDDELG